MNNHGQLYNELMGTADYLVGKADDLLDISMILYEKGDIDTIEYYKRLKEVSDLQNQYVKLRDQAIDADRLYWAGFQEDNQRAREWHEQHFDERP